MGFMRNGFYRAILLMAAIFGLVTMGNRVSAQSSAPVLRIANSSLLARVFWSNNGYYHLLQTAPNLTDSNAWVSIASGFPFMFALSNDNNTIIQLGSASATNNELYWDQIKYPGNSFFRLKQPDFLPLSSFDIFYDGLLEFTQSSSLTLFGAVHANGPINVGTSAQINFLQTVTCTGQIAAPFMDGISTGWIPGNPAAWNTAFEGTPPNLTNVPPLVLWTATNNYHTLIDIPPMVENPTVFPGSARLFNQASVVLLITNAVVGGNPAVKLTLQTAVNGAPPGADPSAVFFFTTNAQPGWLATNLPFLSLTNQFYDAREYKTNIVAQIDIGVLGNWLQTNVSVQGKMPMAASVYPTILFVADLRNHLPLQMNAVRLVNGTVLPANSGHGFTVATPNPLYVKGHYNTQLAGNSGTSAGTSDTTYTVPAALFCDALTLLSYHWSDSASFNFTYYAGNPYYAATPSNTVNGVIVTGNVPTTDNTVSNFSGGVHNLVRLLEDWSSQYLYLNGSRARLWTSQTATNKFRNPYGFIGAPLNGYYNPPTRRYSYDLKLLFLTNIPPGVPFLKLSGTSP